MHFSETNENERVIDLTNNNRIFIRREDPYGFWYISFEKGKVPAILNQAFTDLHAVKNVLIPYLKSKGKEIVKP